MHRMCCCFHYLQRENWNKVLPFLCQTFLKAIDIIQIWNKKPSTQQRYAALVANVSDNQWIKKKYKWFSHWYALFSIDALLLRACALFCSVNIETLHYGLFYSEKKNVDYDVLLCEHCIICTFERKGMNTISLAVRIEIHRRTVHEQTVKKRVWQV